MSAIAESSEGPTPAIQVLVALHPGFDTLDVAGPVEVLHCARHNPDDPAGKDFNIRFVSATEHIGSKQGVSFRAHMDFEDARQDLDECNKGVTVDGIDV